MLEALNYFEILLSQGSLFNNENNGFNININSSLRNLRVWIDNNNSFIKSLQISHYNSQDQFFHNNRKAVISNSLLDNRLLETVILIYCKIDGLSNSFLKISIPRISEKACNIRLNIFLKLLDCAMLWKNRLRFFCIEYFHFKRNHLNDVDLLKIKLDKQREEILQFKDSQKEMYDATKEKYKTTLSEKIFVQKVSIKLLVSIFSKFDFFRNQMNSKDIFDNSVRVDLIRKCILNIMYGRVGRKRNIWKNSIHELSMLLQKKIRY
jgi:hypothetical protein